MINVPTRAVVRFDVLYAPRVLSARRAAYTLQLVVSLLHTSPGLLYAAADPAIDNARDIHEAHKVLCRRVRYLLFRFLADK